ncbi:hypothetical protein CYMTET_46140 [Cymbomonas tetramitiformis]|uniref:Uncharacterized protein n=1 Tax=Cymbomonas tetramitiformis TaxID=36881 RepID=A0AAE0EXW3_9CHLO|nr:hypothetical protein CYMTET_46140 [Cymbomonas tetramitiformis]
MAASQGVWDPSEDCTAQKCKTFTQWQKNVNGGLHRRYIVKISVSIYDMETNQVLDNFVTEDGDPTCELKQEFASESANQAITLGQSVLSFDNQVQFYNGIRLCRKANEDAHQLLKLKREALERTKYCERLAKSHGFVSQEEADSAKKIAAEKEGLASLRLAQAEKKIKELEQAEEIRLLKEELAKSKGGGMLSSAANVVGTAIDMVAQANKRQRTDSEA